MAHTGLGTLNKGEGLRVIQQPWWTPPWQTAVYTMKDWMNWNFTILIN